MVHHGKQRQPTTVEKLLDSVRRVKASATDKKLELNKSQCKYLSQELQESVKFLRLEGVLQKLMFRSSKHSQSKALLQLYSVVKRAENLVHQCRYKGNSAWPTQALTLFHVKYDALDVLVHLRWWASILSMLIEQSKTTEDCKLERVKAANREFEQGLTGHEKLEEAAREDKNHLEHKVRVEIEKIKSESPGLTRKRDGVRYLLLLQVQALLTGKDEHSTPQPNELRRNAVVGQGSSGVVTRVTWCGCDCILKEYDVFKLEDSEVSSLKKCNHPHIVRFFRYWKDWRAEKFKFKILMESMERDLDRHIESQKSKTKQVRPFSEPVAIDIMLQVINAIWHMHDKGIVHGDLKPKNVLVHSGGVLPELSYLGYVHVKLGDFGIAKEDMMTSNEGALTHNAGTTLYRAPELASKEYIEPGGTRKFPRKIDLWSFGIMCSQILTGQQPFTEIEVTKLQAHLERGERPSIPDDCPDYLRFCMESCWKKHPENRPRSSDMWRMLRVAQLRSLGLLDENYDLFTFQDRNNNQVSLKVTVRPKGEGSRKETRKIGCHIL
jgi:serine/threonine protein kinase